jgi:hypothetical protein
MLSVSANAEQALDYRHPIGIELHKMGGLFL